MFDEVLIPRGASLHAHTAAVLRAVLGERCALDIAEMGNGDYRVVVGVEVFRIELVGIRHDFGPPPVAILCLEFHCLVLDDLHLLFGAGEHILAVCDELGELVVLGLELLPFESGQLPDLHLDDGGGLQVGEAELLDETSLGLVHAPGRADNLNYPVYHVNRLDEAFEDMSPLPGLLKLESRPADNDIVTEIHENPDDVLQAHGPRTSPYQGHIVDGEA